MTSTETNPTPRDAAADPAAEEAKEGGAPPVPPVQKQGEIGGPPGPEPTRYGDWEFKGRCSDF
ncbi:DUF1674 domain-containing protein [Arenibaculum pallidiluteum]|uniref:DUF1674 domain-containing protein n=1 Tax=Arenibaculum pallidiluteum TaxID=2812559 RepID=UPI001A96F188|nr:succinate dehydrogenase assembly factor 4 [Arenibaculum pallidiluteum]